MLNLTFLRVSCPLSEDSPEPERVAEDEDDDNANEDRSRLLSAALERHRPAKKMEVR